MGERLELGEPLPLAQDDLNGGRRAADVVSLKDVFAEEVAFQIASDRRQQAESASWLTVFYELRPPASDAGAAGAGAGARASSVGAAATVAVHRKTGVPRQLCSFRKPYAPAAQERLHSCILALQRLSESRVAKVLEVFEDYMNIHTIQALLPLHENQLFHGSLSPESFRFLNGSPHAPLKLVDFGLELKAHRWDAVEGRGDLQSPRLPHFFETCKLVFAAPEFAPPQRRKKDMGPDLDVLETAWVEVEPGGLLDEQLLADVLQEHADWVEQQRPTLESGASSYCTKNQAADVWSIGAMAFLLLCGYPPFFAPARNAILARIHRGEVSFDPPFWSKISEEAKSFVSGCLQHAFWDRFSIQEALDHPWILRLADSSPSGSMFASFMLNLRRFYRTSLIEMYSAQVLAGKFRREDLQEFLCRCREIDMTGSGFFTASDLRHVLTALGFPEIAETISTRFLQTFRHPGESYIDYMALLDSIHLRQQRGFEDELWRHFQRVLRSNGRDVDAAPAVLLEDLGLVFGDPVVVGLLMREIPESPGLEDASVCHRLLVALRTECVSREVGELDFRLLCSLLLQHLKSLC
ncbi:unnamed protein product [Effrenium voratum]|nr:unnamed protein product [Effrenium voratum]